MSLISSLDAHEVEALHDHLMSDFEAFSQFCFKVMTGTKMIHVDYYVVLFKAIQMLIDQESSRMIINIPPRAGKTLLVSIFLPLYAWCKNPCAQTILTGFNSDVLAESSGYIRTIMIDPDFKRVFPDVVIDINKKSIERLGTMSAGVLHAIPTTGKMTGKGCGALVEDFAGLMAIDDVIKPDDANSPTERDKINNRYSNTLTSRLATESTPLVLIMQRLHPDDLCGFLMKGGSDDIFDWLNIPGLIRKETGSQEWYDEEIRLNGYTHVNPILYHLDRDDYDEEGDSSFWSIRKTVKTLKGLREKDPYTFHSQYMGSPRGKGKQNLNDADIRAYQGDAFSQYKIRYTFCTADTASTKQTYSDPTVAVHWGVTADKKLIQLSSIKDKWEVPELIVAMRDWWKSLDYYDIRRPTWKPRGLYMEDKSSGLFLNQQFIKDGTVRVKPVSRDGTAANDKFGRFLNAIPFITRGQVILNMDDPHYEYYKRELLGQSEYGPQTGHDDFADNVSDACIVAFAGSTLTYEDWN